MKRSLLSIAFALLAWTSGLAHAQGGIWTQIPVPGGPVVAVADGDSGRVLIAGNNGAFRYDGFRMRKLPFVAPGSDSLTGTAILRARDGAIWFGTAVGVFRLRTDGTIDHYDASDGLGNSSVSEVSCLAEDAAGNVWVGTAGGGLSRFDGAGWTTVTTDQGLTSLLISSVAVDPIDQSIWVGQRGLTGGLAHVVGGVVVAEWHTFSLTPSRIVRAVFVRPDGDVWFGTDAGIARLAGGNPTEYSTSGSAIVALVPGANGETWFGTSNRGIGRLDDGVATFFASGPPSNSVNGLFVDEAGVLWASTSAGLGRYEGASWLPMAQATGQPPGFFPLSIARTPGAIDSVDAHGVAWIGIVPLPGAGIERLTVARRANGGVRFFGTAEGLPAAQVDAIAAADSGQVWIGAANASDQGGLARFTLEGSVRRLETTSLPSANVYSVCRAGVGSAWAGTRLGVALVDEAGVHALPVRAGAVPDAPVRGLAADAQGRLWIATGTNPFVQGDARTGKGAVRFDPSDSSYFAMTTAEGLPSNNLNCVAVFRNGDVWFGSPLGATRLGAGGTITLTIAQGLPTNNVSRVVEGPNGEAWIATSSGLVAFDGANLTSFGVGDGMNGSQVVDAFADSEGLAVALRADGASLFHVDRVPPVASILAAPPLSSGSREATFAVRGDDLDSGTRGITLATQLDGRLRTAFDAEVTSVPFKDLPDGLHTFRLWAKDNALNETPDPTTWTFEVDATPPRPIVQKPTFNQVVKGTVDVVGSVADARFAKYTIELRPQGVQLWDTVFVSLTPPASDTLFRWDTSANFDGVWELRVGSVDSLGLIGYVQVTTIVDNLAPNASVTAPAKVDHVLGGKVFTTDGSVEIDIPPNAFASDQIIAIDPIAQPALPGGMPPGATWGPSYLVHANDMTLDKPATITLRLDGIPNVPSAIYRVNSDTSVVLLGGQRTADGTSITTTLSSFGGVVVLFGENVAAGAGFGGLRGLDVQPRVLSPNGGGFDTRAAISFEAGKSGNGAVKVFDRAGRLVREVSENDSFAPGHNVVFWDGRDADGQIVPSGIYVVAVRFDGQTQVASIAVANR